jgi:transcriptional regulator with XRE-family HTH domain
MKPPPNLLPAKLLPDGLLRSPGERGRISKLYPDLNISKTARKVPCGQSHLSNILHGKKNGALPLLESIAGTLGISLEELLRVRRLAVEIRQVGARQKNGKRKR